MTRPPRLPGSGRPGHPPPSEGEGPGEQLRRTSVRAWSNGDGPRRDEPVVDPGIVESFEVGERQRVERALSELQMLSVERIRTGISRARWQAEGGEEWYGWLLPRLAEQVEVLPCLYATRSSRESEPKTTSSRRRPRDFGDFVDLVISRLGGCFEAVELGERPNDPSRPDRRTDAGWERFARTISDAAERARERGKVVVLGGPTPTDPAWLRRMCELGVMRHIDIVGVHGFPGTWEFDWKDWRDPIGRVREVLLEHGHDHRIWVTAAGYSTWRHDPIEQLRAFLAARKAPVERVYWLSLHDLPPGTDTDVHADERHHHLGLKRANGSPKLLFRTWAEGGAAAVERLVSLSDDGAAPGFAAPPSGDPDAPALEPGAVGRPGGAYAGGTNALAKDRPVLITGGAGFIGSNLAHRLLSGGERVLVYDSLARRGVESNLRWLKATHGDRLEIRIGDVRDRRRLRAAVDRASNVFHLAAQVAVTTSEEDPETDFQVNVAATLDLLEVLRAMEEPPPLIFTSTNKVYGALLDLELRAGEERYEPVELPERSHGISEERPLEFRSPYGCSKGAADQYVLDYARGFGLDAVVFRMSCIYGPRQFGTEDQGWLAHFLIRALEDEPIAIFGDGRQVRDVLFVDDLIEAFLLARRHVERLSGHAFNIGGGRRNAVSLLETLDLIGELHGEPDLRFDDWRNGDQRWYVSDTRKFHEMTGWEPAVGYREGIRRLLGWLRDRPEIAVREDAAVRSAG